MKYERTFFVLMSYFLHTTLLETRSDDFTKNQMRLPCQKISLGSIFTEKVVFLPHIFTE